MDIPFHVNLYEHTGTACHLNSSNNLPTGVKIIKDIILYTPTVLGGLIAIVVAIGLVVQCCALRQQRVARQLITKLILSLLMVTFFSVADNVMTILWFLVKVKGHHITMARLYISLLIGSTMKIVLLIGYLLGFHFSHICNPLKKDVEERSDRRNRLILTAMNTELSELKSSRVSAPSNTYFNVSHTGEFNTTSSNV